MGAQHGGAFVFLGSTLEHLKRHILVPGWVIPLFYFFGVLSGQFLFWDPTPLKGGATVGSQWVDVGLVGKIMLDCFYIINFYNDALACGARPIFNALRTSV